MTKVFVNMQIQRVVDEGEPTAFKQYFKVWKESEIVTPVYKKEYTLNKQDVAEKTRTTAPAMTRQERAKLLKNLGTVSKTNY
jgi:ribosome recycling factor